MTVDMSRHFTTGALLKFTAPSIAMTVFASLYTIVDGVFVSNFAGKTALAAVNFIFPFIMILSSVGLMIGTGGSAIVAKTRGEGDDERANRAFSMLVWFALVVGVILAVAGFLLTEPVAAGLGAQGQMLSDATLYGRLLFLTLPFFMLQYAFQSFFVTAGKPQLGFAVIVAAGLTNIAPDALFVGALGWGLAGAALATNIGEVVGGGLPLIYFLRRNSSFLRLRPARPAWRVIGKACANGSSEMVANVAMSLVGMLYNFQLLRYTGEDGVAAYGVIMYTGMVFGAIFMGYAMGSSPLMSFQYGARNRREMRSLLMKSLGLIAAGSVAMFFAGQVLAEPLSRIFVSYDAALLELTVHGYRVYALCFLLMGFSIYGSAFFTSLGNGLVSALISFLRTLVFETASVIILPLWLGVDGIWLSVTVAELASVAVTTAFMVALSGHYGYRKRLVADNA